MEEPDVKCADDEMRGPYLELPEMIERVEKRVSCMLASCATQLIHFEIRRLDRLKDQKKVSSERYHSAIDVVTASFPSSLTLGIATLSWLANLTRVESVAKGRFETSKYDGCSHHLKKTI
jgi:hypothetical protein